MIDVQKISDKELVQILDLDITPPSEEDSDHWSVDINEMAEENLGPEIFNNLEDELKKQKGLETIFQEDRELFLIEIDIEENMDENMKQCRAEVKKILKIEEYKPNGRTPIPLSKKYIKEQFLDAIRTLDKKFNCK